jgi:nickel transport protein
LFLGLLLSSSSSAHSLHLTVSVVGDSLEGRVFFEETVPAKNAVVTVALRAEGVTVSRTRTNAEGRFRLPIPCRADLTVKGDADGLHRARATVTRELLPERLPDSDSFLRGFRSRGSVIVEIPTDGAEGTVPVAPVPPQPIANVPSGIRAPGVSDRALPRAPSRTTESMSREELEARRQELLRLERAVGWRDIGAGIGYIVGLFGLLAWWKSRRPSKPAVPSADGFPENPV